MPELPVCKIEELPEGEMRLVEDDAGRKIGVFHCAGGEMFAIEDRCSHDDGPLAEGEFDQASCTVECPATGRCSTSGRASRSRFRPTSRSTLSR